MISTKLKKPNEAIKIPDFEIQSNGDCAVTLIFFESPSVQLSLTIYAIRNYLFDSDISHQFVEIIPAYKSMMFYFKDSLFLIENIIERIRKITSDELNKEINQLRKKQKTIKIPVCYEPPFCLDLASLSSALDISESELIERHTGTDYLVHMLGFLPGFLYLGGLSESLQYPRKKTPSLKVPAGSVGIGGKQTGIYPLDSPGGWHIIGKTPMVMFDPNSPAQTIANPLDRIKFYSISNDEFDSFSVKN